MNREDYVIAELRPDAVEELHLAEKQLSERSGQPITLIAYRTGETDRAVPPARQ